MSMRSEFRNPSAERALQRRQLTEARLARWQGRRAFFEGKDENPYAGWKDCHSHQCLLYARWLLGWLTEYYRREDAQ
jgi:hypothetical protein